MDRIIASWFGTGLILRRVRGSDGGSGTLGSLFALALALWIGSAFGWVAQLVTALVLVIASLWSAGRLVDTEGDAAWIVIDEAAGTLIATLGLAIGPALMAFLVFRIADIFKIPGVKQAEYLPGAIGITADDVVAGLYGLVIGHLLAATVF